MCVYSRPVLDEQGFASPLRALARCAPACWWNFCDGRLRREAIQTMARTSLHKMLDTTDGVRLQLMAEAFNALNRANKAVPNNVIGSGTGLPLASFGRETGAFDARQIQLGVRLTF
jgi:hypothetical protein